MRRKSVASPESDTVTYIALYCMTHEYGGDDFNTFRRNRIGC